MRKNCVQMASETSRCEFNKLARKLVELIAGDPPREAKSGEAASFFITTAHFSIDAGKWGLAFCLSPERLSVGLVARGRPPSTAQAARSLVDYEPLAISRGNRDVARQRSHGLEPKTRYKSAQQNKWRSYPTFQPNYRHYIRMYVKRGSSRSFRKLKMIASSPV